jgi:hypothetical protein
VPIAVPPDGTMFATAAFARARVWSSAGTSVWFSGNTARASSVPEITLKATPSRIASIAAEVACLAALSFPDGLTIEPEASTMTTSAAVIGAAAATGPASVAVTVTTASTSLAPSARNSFW